MVTVAPDAEFRPLGSVRRDTCESCGAGLEQFLDLGDSPLADAFPADPKAPEARYPLALGVCPSCWLVQLLDVVPDHLLFGGDYGFHSSSSPSLRDYHTRYAGRLLADHRGLAERLTVEVGCNDGDLLSRFEVAGCRTLGVDPAGNVADEARRRGLGVIGEAFTADLAGRVVEAEGRAGLVIANHVMAHVPDLDDFAAGLAVLLAPDGVLSVEVQYLPDLLLGNQFDHVYHEHRRYLSVDAVAELFARHGLYARSVRRVEAQGGSIRVLAGHGMDRGAADPARRQESWLRDIAAYASVQGRVEMVRARLLDLLDDQRRAGRKVYGYAASAKSTTLLNFCGIGPSRLDCVVDTTPHKIGRFTPGTHIPIVAPGQRRDPDTYLLLAWNYLPGVLRRERAFLDAGGRFVVPIPVPVLL
jgi:novobiocin biosynthesis protein NovU/D-mycarose 3-C-methyltransferase